MILYQLICDTDHAFESWFASSAAFDEQQDRGLVTCPVCDSRGVRKAIMAPAVAASADPMPLSKPKTPAEAAFQSLREKVEAESDYVGKEFASEARRIHLGEATERGIWGEASQEDAKALHDEGVPIAPLPFMRRADG